MVNKIGFVFRKGIRVFVVLINRIKHVWFFRSSNSALDYYRRKGIKIGEGTFIRDTKHINVDISRPELLEIGSNVLLHKGTIILTHDYASRCFVNSDSEFYPSHGKVKIGNNVWLGENVTICKGVTIGDNCIIGIGSIVTKSIPSNSVAVGIPAKVICSYQDYMKKRSVTYIDEAVEYARCIINSGREPTIEDFSDDYPCFVDGSNYQQYDYPYYKVFTKQEQFDAWLANHKKVFDGFEDFINYCKESI